jgi:CIC family chloride channel protein
VVKHGKRNIIAVLDEGELAGVVYLDDLRPILFNPEFHAETDIRTFMKIPIQVINNHEDMISVINKFDETSTWVLPVVDDQNQFLGFISKSAALNKYRQLLKEYSDL